MFHPQKKFPWFSFNIQDGIFWSSYFISIGRSFFLLSLIYSPNKIRKLQGWTWSIDPYWIPSPCTISIPEIPQKKFFCHLPRQYLYLRIYYYWLWPHPSIGIRKRLCPRKWFSKIHPLYEGVHRSNQPASIPSPMPPYPQIPCVDHYVWCIPPQVGSWIIGRFCILLLPLPFGFHYLPLLYPYTYSSSSSPCQYSSSKFLFKNCIGFYESCIGLNL